MIWVEFRGRKTRLVERLPVYETHATAEWLDPIWQKRVGHFISGEER